MTTTKILRWYPMTSHVFRDSHSFKSHIGNLKTASSSELSSRLGVLLCSLCLCIFCPNLLPRYKAEGGEDRKKPTLSAATLQNLSPWNQAIVKLNWWPNPGKVWHHHHLHTQTNTDESRAGNRAGSRRTKFDIFRSSIPSIKTILFHPGIIISSEHNTNTPVPVRQRSSPLRS